MDAQRATSSSADWPFWAGVFLLAALIRLVGLGQTPLGALEADMAVRAWHAVQGLNPDPAAGGWLTAWMASVFFLAGPHAFWARLLPALFGAGLPLLARAWQPVWGRRVARFVAVLWAVDPMLVAAARLAWGPAVAITLTWAAWTVYRRGQWAWAAGLALAALAAGPTAGWAALALLAIVVWEPRPLTRTRGRIGLVALGLALVLVTTLGLGYPAGLLNGWAGGLVAWAQGWGQTGGVPAVAGLWYAAAGLLWAAWGAWLRPRWGSRTATGGALTAAGLIAGLWLAYPARQAADLAWVSAFIMPWAAQPWARFAQRTRAWVAAGTLAAGLLVLTLFGLLTLAADGLGAVPWWLRLSLAGLAGLAAGLLVVVARGLASTTAVHRGLAWALLGLTALWAGRSGVHAWHAAASDEFWQHDASAADVRALEASLTWWGNRLTRGAAQDLPAVRLYDHPTLAWLQARRFPGLISRPALLPGEQPPVVLTALGQDPGPGYRGQAYRLTERLRLQGWRAWSRWFVYRQADLQATAVVLWLRDDVFAAHTNTVP